MSTSTPESGPLIDHRAVRSLLARDTLGSSPGLKIADVEADNLRKDSATRRAMVWPIVTTFIVANGLVYAGVYLIFTDEVQLARDHVPGHAQVVTANVVLALIAATAAQCGAITVGIFRHFFPSGAARSRLQTGRRHSNRDGARSGEETGEFPA